MGMILIVLGGAVALTLPTRPRLRDTLFQWLLGGGCAVALAAAVFRLWGPSPPADTTAPTGWFGIDDLSAWFLLAIVGVGAVSPSYGVRYLSGDHRSGSRRTGWAHALLAVLIVGLTGVVTATTVVAFLASWEVMAVSAYLLVVYEHEDPAVRRAGLIYVVLTHASTLSLLGMFAAWSGGSVARSFTDLQAVAYSNRGVIPLVLLLGLLGFGIKAGAVPFHFWLPGAHAAAPSHISALLSGVMLKTGVYGLLRVLLLTGAPPVWWAWIVLVVGLASAILGVLWALSQHDVKRLLAYHSVENIGIILLGLGLGGLAAAYGHPVVAALGYTGALLHSLNHSLFKSLLFLGAGSIARSAGTREIDRLGGLARALPRTAVAFGLGSIAIVGLPPLNGFVSEWVIFQGLLRAGTLPGGVRVASVAAAGLALTGGLALACFAKLHGTVFLGVPRAAGNSPSPGSEAGLFGSQLVLVLACLTIGLAPTVVVPIAARIASGFAGEVTATVTDLGPTALKMSLGGLVLIALALLIWLVSSRAVGRRWATAGTWSCAYSPTTGRMQYTAASFASPLLAAFRAVVPIRQEQGPAVFHVAPLDPVLDVIGDRLWRRTRAAASRLHFLQTGRLRWYLLYVIVTLLLLLAYLRTAGGAR